MSAVIGVALAKGFTQLPNFTIGDNGDDNWAVSFSEFYTVICILTDCAPFEIFIGRIASDNARYNRDAALQRGVSVIASTLTSQQLNVQ